MPLVRKGHLKLAPDDVGYDDEVNIEIKEGVTEQDLVVLNGQSAGDGEPVRPITMTGAN